MNTYLYKSQSYVPGIKTYVKLLTRGSATDPKSDQVSFHLVVSPGPVTMKDRGDVEKEGGRRTTYTQISGQAGTVAASVWLAIWWWISIWI